MSVLELVAHWSVAAWRDFWAANAQKEQHIGVLSDFIFEHNLSLSTNSGLWKAEQIVGDLFFLPKSCPAATYMQVMPAKI